MKATLQTIDEKSKTDSNYPKLENLRFVDTWKLASTGCSEGISEDEAELVVEASEHTMHGLEAE